MNVMQDWTQSLKLMQQTVLLTAIRGPDGVGKYHPSKYMLRWYRRCVLLGALDQNVFDNPADPRGGSFTGPSYESPARDDGVPEQHWAVPMQRVFSDYLRSLDELPHHFQLHFMHAAEIIGYKHPDPVIRQWWHYVYLELVRDMHLAPESEADLDYRLGDSERQWRDRNHPATQA